MTTYTIINSNSGEIEQQGVSLADAALTLLTYDDHVWAICPAPDGRGYNLFVSNFSRNSSAYNGLTRSVIFSLETDRPAAEADIFRQVLDSGAWTRPEVMTDEAHGRMLREQAADIQQAGDGRWHAFAAYNQQTAHGYGTQADAETYCGCLNRNREINVYHARALDPASQDDAMRIIALDNCSDSEGFILADAIDAQAEQDA